MSFIVPDPQRFIRTTLLSSALAISLVAGLNYVVDPYDIFQHDLLELKKTVVYGTQRLHKAHALNKVQPRTVFVGTSRTLQGFDPQMSDVGPAPVYNLGIVRASMYEMYRYIQHAAAVGNLQRVYLLADFFSFNAHLDPRADWDEARMATNANGEPQNYKHADLLSTLMSYSASKASLQTLVSQNKIPVPLVQRDGMHNQQSIQDEVFHAGQYNAARAIEDQFAMAMLFPRPTGKFSFGKPEVEAPLEIFEKLLRFCHERDIELYIALSPSHARMYEVIYQRGLWDEFEYWKRSLLQINQNIATAQNREAFPLWDFTGYNRFSTEAMPLSEKDPAMEYFWESVHFKPYIGELLIRKMLNPQTSSAPEDFGVPLRQASIDQHLAALRESRQRYAEDHPEALADLLKSMAQINRDFERAEAAR